MIIDRYSSAIGDFVEWVESPSMAAMDLGLNLTLVSLLRSWERLVTVIPCAW